MEDIFTKIFGVIHLAFVEYQEPDQGRDQGPDEGADHGPDQGPDHGFSIMKIDFL